MKAVAIQAFGAPKGLQVVSRAVPTAGPGKVLIATEAIGVGGVDVLIRSGALAAYGFKEGHVLGSEVVGTITEVGDGVAPSWRGRRVLASLGENGGGYAEYAVADVTAIVTVPEELPGPQAVSLGNAVVAKYSLARADVRRGDRLLVRGASGGIGLMTTQLAASTGITVAATTSSPERGERLRRYGVAEVLDRAGRAEGAPVAWFDAIIDIVAGPEMASFFGKLKEGGRMVLVGIVGGPPSPDFGMAMISSFQKSMIFSTMSLNIYDREERQASMRDLLDLAARGALQPVVHDIVALEDAAAAHEALESGAVFGKVVLVP
jgi:NADPH:quinone reductase-like Zn-dependent oxidoreductase